MIQTLSSGCVAERMRAAVRPMAVVRLLVLDVDEVLSFYAALGFELKERWGPPFAIVSRAGLDLWLS